VPRLHDSWLLGSALWFGLLGGCEADLGGSDTQEPAPDETPTNSDSPSEQVTPEECATAGIQPGPSPLRRLTREDYNHTVRDLLADTTAPASTFPEEEIALNFVNNADIQSVSSLLIEGYENAAVKLASAAAEDVPTLLGCDPVATGEDACMQAFIPSFGLKAYRAPLDTAEVDDLFAFYSTSKATYGFETAVRMTLQAMLQMPQFLYRVEVPSSDAIARASGYEIATRLSYLVWSSMPDQALFDAAASGKLDTPEGIEDEARRLLADPRAHDSVATFFASWLDLGRLKRVDPKDPNTFPTLTAELIPLLREESSRFLDDVFFSGKLETLLLGNYTFLNQSLATYYGITGPTSEAFERVTLPNTRVGFLTQAGFLAGYAKVNETSPIARGLFVRDRMLCDPPEAPPANIPSLPPPSPNATTRERLAMHRSEEVCASCHSKMDPIGFGLEHFDGAGLWRDSENGTPVDATGELVGTDVDGSFDGANELAAKLGQSEQVEQCAVRNWFRYAYGRAEGDVDGCSLLALETAFTASEGNFAELVVELTRSDAFVYRTNE
jgi:hypothetical protein